MESPEKIRHEMEATPIGNLANLIWNNLNFARSFTEISGNEQLEEMLLRAQIAADVIVQRADYNAKNIGNGVTIEKKNDKKI